MTNTNYAVAPGEYLEEWIEDEGLTQARVADLMGVSRKHVNEIVNGHASITPETALALEKVVGIPAKAWLKYEAMYREDLARIQDEESLADHASDIAPGAATYLRKLGVTNADMRHPGKLVSDFLAFHRCGTWDAYLDRHVEATTGDYALAALKDSGSSLDQTLLSTWLRAAELTEGYERARGFDYRAEDLRDALPELRSRAATPDGKMMHDLSGMLAEAGVALLGVEPPKKLPLLGMTRWIDKRVPVIQQTGRWGRDGFVIWTLFHEIGHVLNDPRGELHIEYSTERKRNSAAETGANKFAMKTLFGPDQLEPFRGLTRDSDIAATAKEMGVAPGVAVQQLHRKRWLDYRCGNKLFVDIADSFIR